MIKGIIVDDEMHCADSLLHLLEPYEDKLSIIAVYDKMEEAVVHIKKNAPDVVFLDVQLDNGSTGFDMLQALRPIDFHVVFTTAFNEHAVNAFRFNAVDYLIKPIDEDNLHESIERLFERIAKDKKSNHMETLLANFFASEKKRKIGIPTIDGVIFLEVGQILRCQSDINYTDIFTVDRKKYTVSKTLRYFENMLSSAGFFRVHKSHIVNLDHVVKYTKGKVGSITLSDHTNIEVSVRRKDAFFEAMKK